MKTDWQVRRDEWVKANGVREVSSDYDVTSSNKDPVCPYCGHEDKAQGKKLRSSPARCRHELKCAGCGERFEVDISIGFFSDAPGAMKAYL